MAFNVIIPSANADNLVPCIRTLLNRDPQLQDKIIVIDDGAREKAERQLPPVRWITGIKPFVYSRNCNLGIKETSDDIILLNDDTLLTTSGGLTNLAQVAAGFGGIVSAATNSSGNPNQMYRKTPGIRPEPRVLCFIGVCIPRTVIEAVGLLDERFVHYGYEDNDYCKRATDLGFKLGVYDGCFLDHTRLTSTFRGKNKPGDIAPSRKLYEEKWGC